MHPSLTVPEGFGPLQNVGLGKSSRARSGRRISTARGRIHPRNRRRHVSGKQRLRRKWQLVIR